MGLPTGPRATTPVAALSALQPPFRTRLCAAIRAPSARPPASAGGAAVASAPRQAAEWLATMSGPTASIVIPTQGRPEYLRATLASIASQARGAGAEVLVVG